MQWSDWSSDVCSSDLKWMARTPQPKGKWEPFLMVLRKTSGKALFPTLGLSGAVWCKSPTRLYHCHHPKGVAKTGCLTCQTKIWFHKSVCSKCSVVENPLNTLFPGLTIMIDCPLLHPLVTKSRGQSINIGVSHTPISPPSLAHFVHLAFWVTKGCAAIMAMVKGFVSIVGTKSCIQSFKKDVLRLRSWTFLKNLSGKTLSIARAQ